MARTTTAAARAIKEFRVQDREVESPPAINKTAVPTVAIKKKEGREEDITRKRLVFRGLERSSTPKGNQDQGVMKPVVLDPDWEGLVVMAGNGRRYLLGALVKASVLRPSSPSSGDPIECPRVYLCRDLIRAGPKTLPPSVLHLPSLRLARPEP